MLSPSLCSSSSSHAAELAPQWLIKPGLAPYLATVSAMESQVEQIIQYRAPESIWLVEHPALYTLGTSGHESDVLETHLPVYSVGRGGQATYHGPGQRVVYVMLDLRKRQRDLRLFVHQLEQWIIATLQGFGLDAYTHPHHRGVWVTNPQGQPAKIAAIGVRVRQWVTWHGFALNVAPDLTHFKGIIPCGIREYGVTSMAALGINPSLTEIDKSLQKTFDEFF
jgi:lipoyl(octanoyl) transferase